VSPEGKATPIVLGAVLVCTVNAGSRDFITISGFRFSVPMDLSHKQSSKKNERQWLTPVILATQEAENRRIVV
jgi:hypothetical protein